MRVAQVRPLTGLRFFAALWVALYHLTRANRDLMMHQFPDSWSLWQPVAMTGVRGVDLFFILSGYVLALNYLDRIGGRFSFRDAGRFIWARLARIWPLYVVAIHLCGAIVVVRHFWFDTGHLDRMTGSAYVRQLVLIQEWSITGDRVKTWAGPGWSLSAEWLAYLLFPLLALVVLRVAHVARTRTMIGLTAMAIVPLMIVNVTQESFGGDGWVIRILCEFVAGMLLFGALRNLRLSDFQRSLAGVGTIVTIAAMLAVMYVGDNLWQRGFVIVLFIPLIACLAVGKGPVESLLSTRLLVLGGGISFAFYLIHTTLLEFYRDLAKHYGWAAAKPLWAWAGEVAMLAVIIGVAYLLFRFIEQPARQAMRGMLALRLDDTTGIPDRERERVPASVR
ncbi:acyltransferase family protein [Solicola gregarius]|uniref:Acyltransferase n=1 Tax=Solicola gregarius TaxID=2908642 RepID=A0AA46TIM2_9ACTN|nr:acyltransferase [Solicola gregarius]UYM05935.1 acyltransferase [Solicola gregarius]